MTLHYPTRHCLFSSVSLPNQAPTIQYSHDAFTTIFRVTTLNNIDYLHLSCASTIIFWHSLTTCNSQCILVAFQTNRFTTFKGMPSEDYTRKASHHWGITLTVRQQLSYHPLRTFEHSISFDATSNSWTTQSTLTTDISSSTNSSSTTSFQDTS
jgi:hypothetical protein